MLRDIRRMPVHHHTFWLMLLGIALTVLLLLFSSRAAGRPVPNMPPPIPDNGPRPVPMQAVP